MIQAVRIAATVSSVGLAAALLAGCGGSGSSDAVSATTTSREAVEALRSLVAISPEATGWAWPVKPTTRVGSPPSSFTMDPSEPSYSIQKGVNDAYVAAGIRQYATSSWWDATLKKASSFANLVSTGAGAESAMNAEREFAHSWFPRFEGTPIHEFEADGIGEHSWAVRADTTNASFAEIGWTRRNLVLSVYVSCFPCHSDVTDAARRWAETIDRAASAGRADFG